MFNSRPAATASCVEPSPWASLLSSPSCYVYRFRWYANAAVVAGAILLGYVFNFARLCTLILYYIVALHVPWLRSRAENG